MAIRALAQRRTARVLVMLGNFVAACGGDEGTDENAEPKEPVESFSQTLGPAPESGCEYFENAGKDYWFCSSPQMWPQARAKCQGIGLDLVSIETVAENQFVSSHLVLGTWMGGTDTAVEGQWRWVQSNAQFWAGGAAGSTVGGLIASWTSGEPNNFLNEDCAATSGSGLWNDEYCSNYHSYVCEGIIDRCPADPNKLLPGICGCGTPDIDSDGDGTLDCNDGCPNHAAKTAPGACGCGVLDTDSDADGTVDCNDGCPNDAAKTAPGACGCGVLDTDSDADGTADCNDGCPDQPAKTAPGQCGCPTADTDSDGDGTADCNDQCPADPNKALPGVCGCGVAEVDGDEDGVPSCVDQCPNDPSKVAPGDCGCVDAPMAPGTECADPACAISGVCDGQGTCGDPDACATPDSDCTYARLAGASYWFCNDQRTVQEAVQRCQSVGMELAAVESKAEDDFIAARISGGGNTYLGAGDAQTEGDFQWLATGITFWTGGAGGQAMSGRYANWDVGQPLNGVPSDSDCVLKDSSGKWVTTPCAATESYVCERVLSCKDQCGGYGDDCWCDPGCEQLGDCCPDKLDLCSGSEPGDSCEGHCGRAAGSCWCDPGCEDVGDCCADKVDVCGIDPPVTGSCAGLCGQEAQDCSCASSCQELGNCCPDKIALCGDAEEPGSCVGKCGGQTATCSCDASCHGFGDCCADKIAVCGDESEPSPDGSCEGHCGESAGSCFCDDGCELLGDCCSDKAQVCG